MLYRYWSNRLASGFVSAGYNRQYAVTHRTVAEYAAFSRSTVAVFIAGTWVGVAVPPAGTTAVAVSGRNVGRSLKKKYSIDVA